jgi:phosphoribosylanthranilate isomerase
MSVNLKICGVNDLENLQTIADLGVDFIGLNFVTHSSRSLKIETFEEWQPVLWELQKKVKFVAVVQNASDWLLEKLLKSEVFAALQFHGQESPKFLQKLQEWREKLEFWKVLESDSRQADSDTITNSQKYQWVADRILLDASKQRQPANEAEILIHPATLIRLQAMGWSVIAAGKLTAHNLPSFLSKVQPWAIDIASGVEENSKGIKSVAKIKEIQKILSESSE